MLVLEKAIAEWLELFVYGAECCQKVAGSDPGWASQPLKKIQPAVNGYLFEIREG